MFGGQVDVVVDGFMSLLLPPSCSDEVLSDDIVEEECDVSIVIDLFPAL